MGRSSGQAPGSAYFLPEGGEKEIDRLDIQHYAFALAMDGHYIAPVEEPRRVLDLGCGTAQWCFNVCEELPNSMVIGFDIRDPRELHEPRESKPSFTRTQPKPPNYGFVKGDVRVGLPFADGTIGFVHQRLMNTAIPLKHWSQVVAELVRVTEPGGWVELAETTWELDPEGDAIARLMDLWRSLAEKRGLDTTGHVRDHLDDYLREGGLVNVRTHTVLVPVGDWGDQVGRLMKQDMRSLATQGSQRMATTFHIGMERIYVIIRDALDELEEVQPRLHLRIAYGQRSLLSSTPAR